MADEQATGVAGAVPDAVETRSGAAATQDGPAAEDTVNGTTTADQGGAPEHEAAPEPDPAGSDNGLAGAATPPSPDHVPDPEPDPLPTPATGTADPAPAVVDPEPDPLPSPATAAATPAPVDPVPTPATTETTPAPVDPDAIPVPGPTPGPGAGPPVPTPAPTPAPPAPTPGDGAAAPAAPAAPTPAPPAPEVPELPTVAAATDDPARWGRVDADGTVWTVAPEGDRAVGSWQAGDAAEGLAHYARRFDDLRTEADLLARRLHAGRSDAANVVRSASVLRERLDVASVVGDLPGLVTRLDAVIAAAERSGQAEKSAKAGARDQAVARKEALIGEAETLAEETTRWKHAGDRFSSMLEEWKAIRGIDRKTDDALWKRFAKARETFTRRRGAHFAELDRARTAAKTRKEELVTEAESLQDSEDWGPTAGRYKELMVEWKAAGRTSKDADDALWSRFRGAQDHFFSRRSATFDARDAEFADNAKAKETLLAEAASIDLSDVDAARAALRSVQERWDQVGKVPRERVREFTARLKEVEDRVRAAVDKRWSRVDPEKEARVGQFRERVAQFEAQAAKARAAGDERRAKEADRQADQWREWLAAAERATG